MRMCFGVVESSVTTSSSLKVSDRWTALVGSDPYASNEKPTDNMMQKMWADPRLHGNQKKIGSNDDGSAIFAGASSLSPHATADEQSDCGSSRSVCLVTHRAAGGR